MKVCTCFLLFGIFAYTPSFASNTPKSNQRSVNLALETVLEFSNKDKDAELKFLNNVQNFITKIKTVIDENGNSHNSRRNFKAPKVKTFTGFIQDVIHILNTYEASAFAEFFDILDEEIRNYHYRGCRFYELMENYEIRKLITAKLDSLKEKPTSITKTYINTLLDMLKDQNYDRNVKEFVDYINSLYKQEDEEDFQKVITDLEAYGRSKFKSSNNNLGKIIKNGIRSIIFDHYTNLNTNVRRNVKEKIETFWKQLGKSPPSSGNIPYSKSRNNVKNSEINEVTESERDSRKDLMNLASNKANKKIEIIKRHNNNREKNDIKQSKYKNAEMNRNDVKNEKKRYKHNRKGTVGQPLDTQEKDIRLNSQHTGPIDQQRTKNEHLEHSTTDSSSGDSFSSIEFYQEPHHYTTQYTAIIPIKMSRKPPMNVLKKSEKIEALNVTTRNPINNTVKKIWIEESTGRLPKAVLDKLAVKPSRNESRYSRTEDSLSKHGPRHKKKWHGKIYEPEYIKMYEKKYDKKRDKTRMTKRWSKDDTKYESRQKQKSKRDKKHKNFKTSQPNNPFILVHNRDFFRQNYVRTTDSVFNMKEHKYKKSLRPLRVELKQNKRRTKASTTAQKFPSKCGKTIKSPRSRRTAPPTNSSTERLSVAVPRAYSKGNKMVPWKSADHPSSSSAGMNVQKFEIQEEKRRHGQNDIRISSSLEINPYVINRIKNLEIQLNEIKRKYNATIEVVKAREVKHSDVAKDNIVKHNQSETRFRSDVNMIPNDFKNKTNKPKMSGTADNKTERIIEYKNVIGENSINKEIETDLEKRKKSEARFRSYINMIPNDSKDSPDKTEVTQIEDDKVDVKHIDFGNKEEIINNDHQTMEVNKQQVILKDDKNTETGRTIINEVFPKATDRGIEHKTVTQNREIASLSTSTKTTESTTKTTNHDTPTTTSNHPPPTTTSNHPPPTTTSNHPPPTTTSNHPPPTTTSNHPPPTTTSNHPPPPPPVQPTVTVTTPSTLINTETQKLSTIRYTNYPKLADVLQKAEFNATVDESYNQMANNTSQVADVSKTPLRELMNKRRIFKAMLLP